MENFKVELFKKEHKKEFPEYSSLTDSECDIFRDAIAANFGFTKAMYPLDFVNELLNAQSFIQSINATEDKFSLKNLLKSLNIKFLPDIYINWFRFNDIDKFKIGEVDTYFDSIWFESSDDIDLFDRNLDWIVSIRHDGGIYYLTSPN